MLCTLRFFSSKCSLFHNANFFGSCIIHILDTGCAEIKKKSFRRQRVKEPLLLPRSRYAHLVFLHNTLLYGPSASLFMYGSARRLQRYSDSASRQQPKNPGSIRLKGTRFLAASVGQNRLWDPTNPYLIGTGGSFSGSKTVAT